MTAVVWFRRDLRLVDHPALAAAREPVVPLFVVDPALWAGAGPARRQRLVDALHALDADIRAAGGRGLVVRRGDAGEQVAAVAADSGATRVLVTRDHAPYGRRRDRVVGERLAAAGVRFEPHDSHYLHEPGSVVRGDGGPYSVFTPYYRAWAALPPPGIPTCEPEFAHLPGEPLPAPASPEPAGAVAAIDALERFLDQVDRYDEDRNRPDRSATSRLGAALHFGEIHPRTVVALAGARGEAATGFIRQLCWRDFYADVLFRLPQARRENVDPRFDRLPWRSGPDADDAFDRWARGRTGYPLVDAGMRQLVQTGWLHNRVRMVVASFLTKDLMVDWRRGERWFLQHLVDGDVANNALGWQWCAGTGMDAAPYYRVFNPVLQGLRFDPDGVFVRRFVPELSHLAGAAAHEPWRHPDGYSHGYPERMVDHAAARTAALAAYEEVRAGG